MADADYNIELNKYKEFIKNKITELRLNANISEYQLSLELGKSKGYIQNISSGKALPSMEAFIDICDYFNITPIEFFDEDIKNPDKLKSITNLIKCMSENDLDLLYDVLKRYHELKK